MKKAVRTIVVIFLETIALPIKLLTTICALARMIYGRIAYGLSFKTQLGWFVEGLKCAIALTKKFINTGKYI